MACGWKDDPDTLPWLKDRAARDGWVRRVAVRELARGWKDDPDTLPLLEDRAAHDRSVAGSARSSNDRERPRPDRSLRTAGWPANPLPAMRWRAPHRAPRNIRSEADGNRSPVAGLADPWSCHRTVGTSPRRRHRSLPHPGFGSTGYRSSVWQLGRRYPQRALPLTVSLGTQHEAIINHDISLLKCFSDPQPTFTTGC